MLKQDIAEAVTREVESISRLLKDADTSRMNTSLDGKWSAAQNIVHLSKSIRPVNLSLSLPKFTLLFFGKGGHSRSYEEMVAAYQHALKNGAAASLPFVPLGRKEYDPARVLRGFENDYRRYVEKFTQWSSEELDMYRLPHPILRIITMMEMAHFTTYHLRHHHATVKELVKRLA